MAIDPVCGMEVDPATAQYKTLYKGKVYYFCSPMCKAEFERRPEFYLEHGPQGMPTQEKDVHEHGHEHHNHSGCHH